MCSRKKSCDTPSAFGASIAVRASRGGLIGKGQPRASCATDPTSSSATATGSSHQAFTPLCVGSHVPASALALLGALLGTTAAYLAVIAWAHSSLGTTLSPVPVGDLTAVLIGLPLAATISGWLLAGREPPVIARQPLE
jgi:putative ABC transport system permease protein